MSLNLYSYRPGKGFLGTSKNNLGTRRMGVDGPKFTARVINDNDTRVKPPQFPKSQVAHDFSQMELADNKLDLKPPLPSKVKPPFLNNVKGFMPKNLDVKV